MILSQKRAKEALLYIISRDVNPRSISAKGYGESVLLNGCGNGMDCPEYKHQENRRTEFKITGIKSE